MAEVRDPMLADLLRPLTDPERELDLQVIDDGTSEDDQRTSPRRAWV